MLFKCFILAATVTLCNATTCTECGSLPDGDQTDCLYAVDNAGNKCTIDDCATVSSDKANQCLNLVDYTSVTCAQCGTIDVGAQPNCLGQVDGAGNKCTIEDCAFEIDSSNEQQCLSMVDFTGVTCTECGTVPVGAQSKCEGKETCTATDPTADPAPDCTTGYTAGDATTPSTSCSTFGTGGGARDCTQVNAVAIVEDADNNQCTSEHFSNDCDVCFTTITCGAVVYDTQKFADGKTATTKCGNNCDVCFETITCGAVVYDTQKFADGKTATTECGNNCDVCFETITCGAVVGDTKKFADGKTATTECGNDCDGCFTTDNQGILAILNGGSTVTSQPLAVVVSVLAAVLASFTM